MNKSLLCTSLAIILCCSCKKSTDEDLTATPEAQKAAGTFVGSTHRHTTLNQDGLFVSSDSVYTSTIVVDFKEPDTVIIKPYPDQPGVYLHYEGHDKQCFKGFKSHSGGYEIRFTYHAATDSVEYINDSYSSNYVPPYNSSSRTDTFRGKRQ